MLHHASHITGEAALRSLRANPWLAPATCLLEATNLTLITSVDNQRSLSVTDRRAVVASGNVLTRADLDALPDDGLRHELIDGALVMTPAPGLPHQTMSGALYRALWSAGIGTGLRVIYAPFDVVLGLNVPRTGS